MVGVINQADTGEKMIEAFAEAAKDVETTVAPAAVQGGYLEGGGCVSGDGERYGGCEYAE